MQAEALSELLSSAVTPLGRSCSMFGAWGSRTVNGALMSGRNLDWESDTGVSKHKVISVYKITGGIPYASVGFAGIFGALTGMSAAGITVHGELVYRWRRDHPGSSSL